MIKKIVNIILCMTLCIGTVIPVSAAEKSNSNSAAKAYQQLQDDKYTGWYFDRTSGINEYFDDGNPIADKWITIDGKKFYIKSNKEMAYRWLQLNNSWYFFDGFNGMITGWHKDIGKWYYLGKDGKMLANTITPDGYRVGSDGALI